MRSATASLYSCQPAGSTQRRRCISGCDRSMFARRRASPASSSAIAHGAPDTKWVRIVEHSRDCGSVWLLSPSRCAAKRQSNLSGTRKGIAAGLARVREKRLPAPHQVELPKLPTFPVGLRKAPPVRLVMLQAIQDPVAPHLPCFDGF